MHIDSFYRHFSSTYKYIVVRSLVGCSSDGLVNDSYVENDNRNDADADGGDDDTTLVKQSESVAAAAAAVSTREHLESKIADLQRYTVLLIFYSCRVFVLSDKLSHLFFHILWYQRPLYELNFIIINTIIY